jgi:hypothetical protein
MPCLARDAKMEVLVCLKLRVSLVLIGSILVAACKSPAGPDRDEIATASTTSEARSAILSELQNSVDARQEAAGSWQSALEGQQLEAGGGAKTGEESRVRIDITDGTLVRIAANTVFELSEFSPEVTDPFTILLLEAGRVFVQLTRAPGGGTFVIETPVGSATVRGSLMSVAYDPVTGRMTITCLEGQCRLSGGAGGAVDLRAGEQSAIAGAGQNPAPGQPMDDAQLAEWAREFPEAATALALVAALPRATAIPTPIPTSTPAPDPVAQSACDHPYLPLRSGASWTYTMAGGDSSLPDTTAVISVQGDTQNATAETNEYTYQCDALGIRYAVVGNGHGTVTNSSGVYLPPAESLALGVVWNYDYEIVYDFAPDLAGPITHLTHTVTGTEPVTLNGATYEGLQILVEVVNDLPPVLSNQGPVEYSYRLVFARGVGVVEQANRHLVEFSIP